MPFLDFQIDLQNWTIPVSRRFRAIRIWFMMKWFGKDGMIASSRQHIGEHLTAATIFLLISFEIMFSIGETIWIFSRSILNIQDNIPGSMGTCLLSTQIWWQCRPWKSCPGAEAESRNIDYYVCMERNNLLESNFQSIHDNWEWCWWNLSKDWNKG